MTIQEEKRRQRLIERETEKENITMHDSLISHICTSCPDVTPYLAVLAERAFTSLTKSAQNGEREGLSDSFPSPNMLVFYNHRLDCFLMIARSMRVISNIHHPTYSGQDTKSGGATVHSDAAVATACVTEML